MLYPKPGGKCQVSVQHDRLPSASAAEKMKKFWKARLQKLGATLE
jgi:hypothetical protein